MKKKKVKEQRGGTSGQGFDVNPQNINRTGLNDSSLRWKHIFQKLAEERDGEITRREVVADAVWRKAEKGDISAFKEIRDTMDGKPVQPEQHEGEVTLTIKKL